jgi:hypothetical protein
LILQSGEDQLKFNGSYNQLRNKPTFGAPENYETLSFFPDKSLTLTAKSNNLISGLTLEAAGLPMSWFRVNRMICTEMPVLNGPISQVCTQELLHQPANKGYVDNRFIAYTPTEQMNLQFQSVYARKSDLQTTD